MNRLRFREIFSIMSYHSIENGKGILLKIVTKDVRGFISLRLCCSWKVSSSSLLNGETIKTRTFSWIISSTYGCLDKNNLLYSYPQMSTSHRISRAMQKNARIYIQMVKLLWEHVINIRMLCRQIHCTLWLNYFLLWTCSFTGCT